MRLWQFFDAMAQRIYFIIGTDTGVGKTVFTALLTRRLREKEVRVAALKPLCSGGREDARVLRAASGHVLSLDEINPWHFRAPLAPLLAAIPVGLVVIGIMHMMVSIVTGLEPPT